MGAHDYDVESASRQQNVGEKNDIDSDFERVPKERKKRARCVSIILCTITAILLIIFCIVNRNVVEYYPDATQKNTTNVCYRKEEKLTFPGLFATALGLFGVVLGTLVDRLSLITEEYHHLHQRYDGSRIKMIKACFSGIVKGPVFVLLGSTVIIVVILILTTGIPWFELSYLVDIFGGIGVGPLVMHLLHLNTQSTVHISAILEEKGMRPGYTLAWSYYYNYLRHALPKFKEIINCPYSADYESVSLKKLLLLIPFDCYTTGNVEEVDRNITRIFDTADNQEPFHSSVYRLTVSEREQKVFAIQYVKEPLETLREMSNSVQANGVNKQTCEEEVKLLYATLFQILEDPPDQDFKETCVLVPVIVKDQESLNNGGLVRCIMDTVHLSRGDPRGFVDGRDPCSFVKPRNDESNDKKEKKRGKILKSQYKNKKLEVMIPEENHDPSHTNQPTSKLQHLAQEDGDGNDSGAITSWPNGRHCKWPREQSEQQDDHSSNNTQHQADL